MNPKHRIVLAGCGSICGEWLNAVAGRQDAEIVAVVDLRREAAEKRAEQFHLANALITTDLTAALKRTSPDVLFNCTIPEAHAPVTIQALKSGCHVLCEKPLADTMSNARKMIAAARRTKKVFAVIQNRRYDANIRRLRGFLASGAIGKITTVQSNFFLARHFGGFRDRMEHVLLLDMAIHTFDAARFIAGADPVSVYCHEWNPKGSWYDHDAAAVAVFEMTGGIVYTYQGSWCAYGLPTKWEADWRVIGQKGSVRWDGAADFTAQAVTDEMASPPKYVDVPVPEISCPGKSGGHAGLIADFLDCIRTRRTPETVGADNVRSLAMVHGAIASASRKRRVAIEA